MTVPGSLVLRRIIWPDGRSQPDDFSVIHEGETVGRIYRMDSTGRETWQWTQIGERAPTHGPNGGIADSLGDAIAAFRNAWEAQIPSHNDPALSLE